MSDATGNDGLLGIITAGEECLESGIMLRNLYNKKFEYFISVYFDKNKFNKEKWEKNKNEIIKTMEDYFEKFDKKFGSSNFLRKEKSFLERIKKLKFKPIKRFKNEFDSICDCMRELAGYMISNYDILKEWANNILQKSYDNLDKAEDEKLKIIEKLCEMYDGFGLKLKKKENPEKEDNFVQEELKKEETKKRKSSKLAVHYDDAKEEVKAEYDKIMKKSFTSTLNKLSNEEVAYLNSIYRLRINKIDMNNLSKEDAVTIATAKKISNRYNKLARTGVELNLKLDEKAQSKAEEIINKKL